MAGLTTQRARPAVQGVDLDNSPEYVGDLYGSRVTNLLTRGGALQMRGSITSLAEYTFGGTNNNDILRGLMAFDDQLLVNIDAGGNEHLNLTSLVSTNIADAPAITSKRYARVGANVYGPGSTVPGSGLQLLRWPGGAVAATALAVGTAPIGTVDCVEHLERLFTLGGNIGAVGGVSHLMWTDPGGTTGAGVLTDWQDNTTGLTNSITVGAIDNDISVGLGKVDRSLAIFKKRSLYVLSGQTPTTFQVRRFSDQIGCVNRDSICSYNDGCYFLSERGLMYFDGAQLQEVSRQVRGPLQLAIRQAEAQAVANRYYCVGDLGSGCLLVVIGDSGGTPGGAAYSAITPRFQYMYDTIRDTWVELTFGSTAGAGSIPSETTLAQYHFKPQHVCWANSRPVITDAFQCAYGDEINIPRASVSNAGRDNLTFPSTGLGGDKSIMAEFVTRSFKLASPPNKSQLHRLFLDYDHNASSGTLGWNIAIVPTGGVVANALLATSTATNAGAADVRARAVFDVFTEAEEVQVKVYWPDKAATVPTCLARIMDGYIEYQPAAHRTG